MAVVKQIQQRSMMKGEVMGLMGALILATRGSLRWGVVMRRFDKLVGVGVQWVHVCQRVGGWIVCCDENILLGMLDREYL